MALQSSEDAMPWVGLFITLASLLCTMAMGADVVLSFWQRKLWCANKIFTLSATSITFITIAAKLPMDISGDNSTGVGDVNSTKYTKIISIMFVNTMLVNFIPSLASMDKELMSNIVALGIVMITICVDVGIQLYIHVFSLSNEFTIPALVFPTLCLFSLSLTISSYRKQLEKRYMQSRHLISSHLVKRFSSKELKGYVKKHWMMTKTHNHQLVIAYSPVASALGVLCLYHVFCSFYMTISINENWYGNPTYKWSMKNIFDVQSIGILVGSVAPVLRCLLGMGYYSNSVEWSKIHLNPFRVEESWTHNLQKWKCSYVGLCIPSRLVKKVINNTKYMLLNIIISLHIVILIICKVVSLFPRIALVLLSWCCYFIKKLATTCNSNVSSEVEEIDEYSEYVVQIEEEERLSKNMLRNALYSVTCLIEKSEKKEPRNLLKLLEKSTRFNGVLDFDNDQVEPLCSEEPQMCWSLVVVTLTSTAIALSNHEDARLKGLLSSVREGLDFVTAIEDSLYANGDLIKSRKAARHVWAEVEVYRTCLSNELNKEACKGSSSKDILTWLSETSKNVIRLKSTKNASEYILANSMYRISQTILMHFNEQENWPNDEAIFEWISITTADVLSACFTNLPRAIMTACYHHTIEKRGESVRKAAQLLGRSKKVLKYLKQRQLPEMDQDSMAFLDKWRVVMRSLQLSNPDPSPAVTQGGSNESHEITVIG